MKEGWEYKKLGEVCDFQNGFAFKSNLFEDKGIGVVRISDIQNGEVSKEKMTYVNPQTFKEDLSSYTVRPNDILIAMSGGTTGKLGINKTNETFFQNQRVGLFREHKDKLNHMFLYYFLHTKSEESLKIAAGAAQPNLSTAQIKQFQIPIPSLSEQQQIVEYLDAQFKRIDALKANAEQQLQAAKDLFQSSIDNFFKLSQSRILKDLVDIINGYAFKSEDFKKDAELKIIKITNVGVGEFIEDDSRINIIHKNLDIAKVYENDIVIALTRTIISSGLKVAIIPRSYNEALLNQRVACLRENKKSSIRYIYYYLSSNSAIKYVLSKVNTLMQPNLSINDLKNMPVPYVNIEEQQNIVAQLDDLSAKVKQLQTNYEQTITHCNDLKQSLLKKVFE